MLRTSNSASNTVAMGEIFMRNALFICFQHQKSLLSKLQLILKKRQCHIQSSEISLFMMTLFTETWEICLFIPVFSLANF